MHLDTGWALGERGDASEHRIVNVTRDNDRSFHDSFSMFRLVEKRPRQAVWSICVGSQRMSTSIGTTTAVRLRRRGREGDGSC